MKDLFSLLDHAYGKNAVKSSLLKKEMRSLKRFFEDRKIPCKIKDDLDLMMMSAQRDALVQKERLDEQLFRSIDSMQDYISTLHYDEINRLLLVDLKEIIENLKQFTYHEELICLPCFSPQINERYLRSPALYTFPSYQHQLRHYTAYLQWGMYGNLPYEYGFGIFECIESDKNKQRCVLYLQKINRFYLLESGTCIQVLPFPTKARFTEEEVHTVAKELLDMNAEQLASFVRQCDSIKRSLRKKIEKLEHKKG